MPWPPRSPDLTHCDFFLWGFIKNTVYAELRPRDIPELKERIRHAFRLVTVEMRQKTVLAYRERLERVIENAGAHTEVHSR